MPVPEHFVADRSCPIVAVSGTPRRRGESHGEQLRDRISSGVARWHDALASETGQDPTTYLDDFLATTDFLASIRRWTPDLLDEIEGIAAGSNQSYETILAYNLMDEEWLHQQRWRPSSLVGADEPHHCSAMGLRPAGGRPTIVAQNMDLPLHMDGSQCVLHVVADNGDPDVIVLTAAGLIATTGANSAGVGTCMNALFQLDNEPEGLPVAFAIRGLLRRRTRAEAVEFLESIDHASGQNYLVGDRTGVTSVECSARGTTVYEPDGPAISHTNHPLASEDTGQHLARMTSAAEGGESAMLNSKQRLALLEQVLDDDPTIAGVVTALRDETVPVCRRARPDGGALTFGTVLLELGQDPVVRVAPGPPTQEPFRTVNFV